MHRPAIRGSRGIHLLRAAALSLALVVLACVCAPALAASEPKESAAEYRQQLAHREIQSATINKLLRRAHLVLSDGRHVIYVYPPHGHEQKLIAELQGKHVSVTVLTPTQAKAEAKKALPHHKIRYIVGGVVIAVIVVVGAILLINRRRRRDY
jgi:hypothetical protein